MGSDLSWYGRQPNKQLQAQCAEDLSRLAEELGWDYDLLDGSTDHLANLDEIPNQAPGAYAARYCVVVFPWCGKGNLQGKSHFPSWTGLRYLNRTAIEYVPAVWNDPNLVCRIGSFCTAIGGEEQGRLQIFRIGSCT